MVRAATLDDARAIAELHVASVQTAYRGLMPDAHLDGQSVEERCTLWETLLTDGETTVLVADHPIAGFVSFDARKGWIGALYVDPTRLRSGVGTALLAAAHDHLADRPEVVLWVLQGNTPAFAFYARHGYEADGGTAIHEPSGSLQLRMARKTPE
jgi:ribosomal protein S18 acetylase RimI-like enzyme